VHKFVITHPEFTATNWSVDDQVKLAEKGAVLEHCANQNIDPKLWASNIKRVGAEHCVLSSDSGQLKKGNPIVAMGKFVEDLTNEGLTEYEIEIMLRKNPKMLLDLD
jgi:predicted metal-dependent phosphotriesterase family hydrolase